MNPQTLVINDRKWVATYNPPEYGGWSGEGYAVRKGFWSEETFTQRVGGDWYPTGGGPIHGVTSEQDVRYYLLEQANKTLNPNYSLTIY